MECGSGGGGGSWSFVSLLQTPPPWLKNIQIYTHHQPDVAHTHTHLVQWEPLGVETVILFSNQVICDKLIKSPSWNTFSWEKPSQVPPPLNLAAFTCWLIFLLCQNKGSVHRHVSALKQRGSGLSYLWFKKCTAHSKISMKQSSLTIAVLELLLKIESLGLVFEWVNKLILGPYCRNFLTFRSYLKCLVTMVIVV